MKLLCKLLGHSVETTHTNQHQIATGEKCSRCGLSRKLNRIEQTNCVQWVYSDGRKSVGVPIMREDSIEFGNVL